MTIAEFGDVINADLCVKRYANQKNRWVADFKDSETKEYETDSIISGTYGEGESASEAIAAYVEKIKGKWIVVGGFGDKRRDFGVPHTLTV